MDLTMGSDKRKEGEEPEEVAFAGVLRSKGFCWMAPQKWSGGFGSDGKLFMFDFWGLFSGIVSHLYMIKSFSVASRYCNVLEPRRQALRHPVSRKMVGYIGC